MKPIDIFITTYMRPELTWKTLFYLKQRTQYPHRVFLIDNGGNDIYKDKVDYYIGLSKNMGIHAAWNIAASLAESEYFITSDNDILVPDTRDIHPDGAMVDDWLGQMVKFMDERPDYGAISLH